MGILIDTSVLIAAERGRLDLRGLRATNPEETLAISAITATELLFGLHRSRPDQRARREVFVQRILEQIPVLPFDLMAARVHSGLAAEMAGRGVTVGSHDLLIAATALAKGFQVAALDRDYKLIPGLPLALW